MTRSTLALLLAALAVPATAQTIYRCTDANGGMLISNARVDKSCKAVVSSPDSTLPAPKAKVSGAAANPSPAGFPRVQEDTQKARDTDRRRILDNELAAEQKNLDEAKKALADQEAVILPNERQQYKGGGGISGGKVEQRIAPYRDKVALHERNIEAIQKEIAKLR